MSESAFSSGAPRARLHPAALVGFLLGLVSLGLWPLGVPAVVVSLRGLRAVNTAAAGLRGARLAVAGLVLGGLSTLALLFWVGWQWLDQLNTAAARATCANNLRVIGVALNKYADAHKEFPPATRTPPDLPPERRISWLADALPLMAEGRPINANYQALEADIDRTRAWDDPANAPVVNRNVRAFLCPGHPDFDPNRPPGLTHYVGVAGIGPRAAYLDRRDPRAGMFGHGRGVRQREITRGISQTMMVLETAHDNGPWLAGGFPTVRGLGPDVQDYIGPGRPFGGLHRDRQREVMNVLWADGSVRVVSENIDAELFRRQATIRAEP